ncbi:MULTISPECIES: thiamine phosphate synthase [unclassified Spirosoma]|uniref:thiamine phosphate synthase n=1 Tax=unclassified Spirosoma TaxID=2621999 RepID=UPI001AC2628C|nr:MULTISPECIES: thiamine phosphate synthase [unclassified Spirosoma]MBN8821811.1 thiamine phosphate synthase [Spirosoma sp.]
MDRLYLVTDSTIARMAGHTLPFVVEEACRAGVRWVQLREKELSTRAFLELATEIKAITQTYGANLIINDRVDIALALDADGVHVGQDDMPYSMVRSLIGPDKIIGLSINNLTELQGINSDELDYLGIATVFPTGTKQDTSSLLGLEGLRQICSQTSLPTFAIGGINAQNVQLVMQTGVTGAAVVSAICGHSSPYEASRELLVKSERVNE